MERLGAGRVRERVALGAAVALHAFALIALWRSTAVTTRGSATEASNAVELDIDVSDVPLASPPEMGSEPSGSPTRPLVTSHSVVAMHPRLAAAPAAEPAPGDEAAGEDGADESAAATTPAAPERHVDLGVGADDWRRWLPVAKPDITAARAGRIAKARVARPASSTFGVQEALEAHDRAIGMSAAGPLVSALYRAAHDPSAPQLGTARFDVTVLKSGGVEIRVSDFSSDLPAWREVANRAAEALRRSPPRIPGPRKGLHAVLEITAEEAYPNGTKRTDLESPHVEGKLPKLKTAKQTQEDLEKLNPTLGQAEPNPPSLAPIAEIPGVYVAGRNKVCSYRLGLTPFGPLLQGGCDPSNIATRPQRMVHTQVVEEALF